MDTTQRYFVSFSGGDRGPTKVLPRLALLGPLKHLMTNGQMSKQNYKMVLDAGKEDFELQQPLKLGEESLPAFSMGNDTAQSGTPTFFDIRL